MDATKAAELEHLLEEALRNVVIRIGEEQLSQANYRQNLQRCRVRYERLLKRQLSFCRIDIQRSDTRDKLLSFATQELADYIRDDRIQSATIAFAGGLTSGSPVENVVHNLIRQAIVDGPAVAAQALLACTTMAACSFYEFFLLSGLRVEETTEVFDGLTLIPLPASESELPPHLPFINDAPDNHSPVTVQDLLEKTLVRVECEVSPVFHRPAKSYTFESGPDRHFTVKMKGDEVEDFNLGVLWQAMGVVSRSSVRPTMSWISLLDYEVFDLSTTWGIGGGGYEATIPVVTSGQPVKLSRRQLDTIPALYKALSQPETETWTNVKIPIHRWMKSLQENDPSDQLIDIVIALESLYVPDSQSEVNFRLALHAAWHLGQDKKDRRELKKFFQQIYQARSDVVHTGQLRHRSAQALPDLAGAVSRAQELCWQGITSILNTGERPPWDSLILGEDLD